MATLNGFQFGKSIAKLNAAKINLPLRLADISKKHFLNNFQTESFDGQKWAQVKRRQPGTTEFAYPKKTDLARHNRKILQGKPPTRLFKSIVNSFRKASWNEIILGSDVPYAQFHNEGTDKLPKRTFMAHDRELDKKVRTEIKNQLDKVFKP